MEPAPELLICQANSAEDKAAWVSLLCTFHRCSAKVVTIAR